MAILRDMTEDATRMEFKFIHHIRGKDEGCRLNFQYFRANHKVYDLDFGWTNITINNYIDVTSKFPLERLNGFYLNGLYSSFEKHLYHLDWEKVNSEGLY